ncbi:hypothetical protein P0F65_16050 [Sphingomonas sp. I4]
MLALILTATVTVTTPIPAGLAAYVRDRKLTRYDHALSDLNGDGRPEALVYAWQGREGGRDMNLCGSGGCNLTVLSLTPTGYRVVSTISITRPPIRVLAGMSNGWHDLSVLVAGVESSPVTAPGCVSMARAIPPIPASHPPRRSRGPNAARPSSRRRYADRIKTPPTARRAVPH